MIIDAWIQHPTPEFIHHPLFASLRRWMGAAQLPERIPFVDLDPEFYKLVGPFEQRFPRGVPSLRKASSLVVRGDWTFGPDVVVAGEVAVDAGGSPGRIDAL